MVRTRSEQRRRAILDAAIAELEDHGYAALTVDGIAARAGAGKQTIYRWWTSKADVVFDAILDLAATRVPDVDTGALATDLAAFMTGTFHQPLPQRQVLAGLMAQSVLDPAFAADFRNRFLHARRDALRTVLDRAAVRGELDPDVDPDLLVDVVFGVLWYRLLVEHAPLDEGVGHAVAELVVRAAAPHGAQPDW